jgi:hypothetical protein
MAAVAPASPADQPGGFNTRAQEVSRRMLVAMHKAGLRNDRMASSFSPRRRRLNFGARVSASWTDYASRCAMRSCVGRTLGWRNVLIGAALLVAAVLVGAGGGYWFRGKAPVLVGVRAGAQHCEDRNDGSRLCWIPVFERLPPGR